MKQENNIFNLIPVKNILFLYMMVLITTTSCKETKKVKVYKPYKGPSMVVYQLEALLTDSAQPKILMKAPRQIEYENGDRLFPDGVNIEFFGEKKQKSSILTARKGKFNKARNIYTVTDNVEIINKEEGKKLNTEELHWNPDKKLIYTDKFVRIETKEELLTGTGLESSEDFDNYKILKVKGIFPMKK